MMNQTRTEKKTRRAKLKTVNDGDGVLRETTCMITMCYEMKVRSILLAKSRLNNYPRHANFEPYKEHDSRESGGSEYNPESNANLSR